MLWGYKVTLFAPQVTPTHSFSFREGDRDRKWDTSEWIILYIYKNYNLIKKSMVLL